MLVPLYQEHPCFTPATARWFRCVLVPVADRCNISCTYCSRRRDCLNGCRGEATLSKLLTPREALRRVQRLAADPRVQVVCVAGPAEPLAGNSTFAALQQINAAFPHLLKCVATNGLLLPEKAAALAQAGVSHVAVTVNAVDERVAARLYRWVSLDGKVYQGREGARLLIARQLEGIREACRAGLRVKVNTLFFPGINTADLRKIGAAVRAAGAVRWKIVQVERAVFSAWE